MQGVAVGGSPLVRQMLSEAFLKKKKPLHNQELGIPDRFNL
jgi:hypothetical protein